jgi:hypothetical protein
MMNLGKKLGFAALLAFGSAASVQAMVLDTFDYDVSLQVSTVNGSTIGSGIQTGVTNTVPAGDVAYTLTATSNASFGALGGANATNGSLYHFNTDGTSNLELNYFDLVGGPSVGLDITDSATSSAFYFDVEFIDLGFFVDFTITDISGAVSTFTYNHQTSVSLTDPTERVFADFSNFIGSASFANVAGISAVIRSTESGADLRISEVGTTSVPEPTTIAIFGLALIGFAFNSKRKA